MRQCRDACSLLHDTWGGARVIYPTRQGVRYTENEMQYPDWASQLDATQAGRLAEKDVLPTVAL